MLPTFKKFPEFRIEVKVVLWSNVYPLIFLGVSYRIPWKDKNAVYRLKISALVPEIFKFEKLVKYANEMTDDVIHSTQYSINYINRPRLKKIIWMIGVLRRTVVIDWRFDNLCESHLQSQVVMLVSWKFKNPGERFDWLVDRVAVGKCVMWLAVKTCAERRLCK